MRGSVRVRRGQVSRTSVSARHGAKRTLGPTREAAAPHRWSGRAVATAATLPQGSPAHTRAMGVSRRCRSRTWAARSASSSSFKFRATAHMRAVNASALASRRGRNEAPTTIRGPRCRQNGKRTRGKTSTPSRAASVHCRRRAPRPGTAYPKSTSMSVPTTRTA
jgi:hypothetical protein